MFYDILDQKRLELLPRFKSFKERFFLAGGTGLALQMGHRTSIDFDFFCEGDFDTAKLFQEAKEAFDGFEIIKVQEEKNTLSILASGIKISFFKYPYPLAGGFIEDQNLKIASIIDICLMKMAAIVSRVTMKDYVDLYFIFQNLSLGEALAALKKTIPELDENLVRKSLVYFADVKQEPIDFKNNKQVDLKTIEEFLKEQIKNFPPTAGR